MNNLRIEPHVSVDDDGKVISQYKRHPLSLHAKLALEIAQKVPKVNVEELAVPGDHDVVGMPIPDPQHIGGHAVPGTRVAEVQTCSLPPVTQ